MEPAATVPVLGSEAALHAAIRAARVQHQAGMGSVLDVLLRTGALGGLASSPANPQVAGAVMLLDPSSATVDVRSLDGGMCLDWRCALLRMPDDRMLLASEDPWNEALLQKVARLIGSQPAPAAATSTALTGWLGQFPGTASVENDGAPAESSDSPIVAFVDQAIDSAIRAAASDVHFECDRRGITVQFRLDGVMSKFARMEGERRAEEVISRIKVMAQLDITERRAPQDGRFRYEASGAIIDLRVSIMPNVHGEDAVLRLLDRAQLRASDRAVTLDALGFEFAAAATIRSLALAPSGMLLVTGPTGSGKTTTVYAALSEINDGLEKIITIEDPVEYELPGVLQIPVNERKGLTFARGLRSILRHDPDRILVGEIRDAETAEIAVQSALTGHLVFTTVHANSVSDVVGRFRHFGLDMYGFMSSLNGVVVQRLMRRVCHHCAGSRAPTEAEKAWLGAPHQKLSVPVPRGCSECRGSGFRGRFVVAELHRVDDTLRDLVTTGAPLSALKAHATSQEVRPLLQQAAGYVAQGMTTCEEVRRVIGDP
jgi:general secretion pathway protein E